MRRGRPVPRKGWFGAADAQARAARRLDYEIGTHFADASLHSAIESLQYRVIPGFDADYFRVVGETSDGVAMAKQVLLGSQSDIWYDAGICRAFQQYVTELFYFRRSWSYIQFGDDSPVVLERLDGFAPETVFPVGHGAGRRVDQYVRRQGEQPEAFFRFEPDELFELEWPLAAPVGSHTPYAAALRIGLAEDRLMERAPLAMRAQTEPDERLLPFVRARLGAYDDSIAEVRRVSARVRDSIFEPVTEPVTRFFEIDRVVRTQIAACEFRDYLIREFNRQVLGRWATANAWGLLELEWVPAQFSATDWRDVGQGFRDRELSYDDIVELLRVDRDATLRKNLSP